MLPSRIKGNLRLAKYTFLKIGKWFFGLIGAFAFLLFILSFTDIPYYAYYNLGTAGTKLTKNPDVIVVLGGAGMPSADGLIRTYYAAEAAKRYANARIIIALPYNTQRDSLYQLKLMARELIVKDIDSLRIMFEPLGYNTRSQAMNIAALLKDQQTLLSLLIITTPEHMYRAIYTFKKAGFTNVGSLAAFEKPIEEEKLISNGKTGEKKEIRLSFRYNMWSYLHYELLVLKEYTAITYYKLRGWL
jgi:uncharacterized SAM-binding protein YcdF (DUF218 family)